MENPVGRAGRGATEPPETTCDVRSETLRLAQWASHLQNSSVPPSLVALQGQLQRAPMKSLLQQRVRQFLIHSFLYYHLGDSVISDTQYDRICQELAELLKEHPGLEVPYRELTEQTLGTEASGYTIRKFPPPIVSSALHLLYQARYRAHRPLPEFLSRQGYRIAEAGA